MEPMINLINILLNNDGTSLDDFKNIEEYKEFLYLHLTHLHTKHHNVFSPSHPSDQHKFGTFLFGELRILNINENQWFSDNKFTFFSNILNLDQDYCPTIKALHQKVPQLVFCNSYDDCTKINPMLKK